MFVGHTAVALAARSRSRNLSLGAWMAAAFTLDLVWPVLLLTGLEEVRIVPHATAFNSFEFVSYPWSHSLLMAMLWGACAFCLARWRNVSSFEATLLGAVVVSHWVLDLVTHVPDLPLWPGGAARVGMGLWQSVPGTLAIEGALFAAGVAMYVSATRARDRRGGLGFWLFLLVSVVIWASSPWSAPPPNARLLAIFSFAIWLLIGWAARVDRHRVQR